MGANTPEEYGNYYAWGETKTKDVYDWSTYIHCDGSYETCHDIGSDIAGTGYDAATANWGTPWQMLSLELSSSPLRATAGIAGLYGRYWSSLRESYPYYLYFDSGFANWNYSIHSGGYTVRLVR